MDDSMIIELFFQRSENAISELSSKYGPLCLRTSVNITNNVEDAQECVNDAYLGVWNAIPPRRPGSLSAYVLRIVRNISINRVRQNNALSRGGRYQEVQEELVECVIAQNTTEEIYDAKLLSGYITEFLGGLSRINRLLFIRRYWYLDSYEDLSAATGLREGAVRTRLSRLRQQLKCYLGKRGVNV